MPRAPGNENCLVRSVALPLMLAGWMSAAQAAEFTQLDDLPGGQFSSFAFGISADGSAAAGASKSTASAATSSTTQEAYLWTASGGLVPLGDLPGGGFNSEAYDISDDGTIIAGLGRYGGAGQIEAIRWTAGSGLTSLGALMVGGSSQGTAISADGSVIVGGSTSAAGTQAFRWTAGDGMVGLGDLPTGGFYSFARGVSADGSIVVGSAQSNLGYEAFVWTDQSGMTTLGDLPGGTYYAAAYGVSDDGSVVVGGSNSASSTPKNEAFRWTAETGIVGLGDLPGGSSESYALAVSGDGEVIVGFAWSGRGQEGVVWTETGGLTSLTELLETNGVFFDGLYLGAAYDVSANGRYVSGSMTNANGDVEAYIVDLQRFEVLIDFEPWNAANEIRPEDSYFVTVGIETTDANLGEPNTFDSSQVDVATLRFGPAMAPNVASPLTTDFDSDGDSDTVFGFRVEQAGIICDDTEVTLSGETWNGETFIGTDSITTTDCETSGCHP